MSDNNTAGDEHVFAKPSISAWNRQTAKNNDDKETGKDSLAMQKRISSMEELEKWKTSTAHKQLIQFVQQLNHFATDKSNGVNDYEEISIPSLCAIRDLLTSLNKLIDEVPPLQNDRGQRFGNKAFRIWIERMEELTDRFGCDAEPVLEEEARQELCAYLRDSFGNYQRIDYGTGHELNFLLVLLGVYKIQIVCQKPAEKKLMKSASEQILRIWHEHYLPLCRRVQLTYRLEPAGSHGVFSLDDFQFLPFLFGSAELIGNNTVEPHQFPDEQTAARYAPKFMFLAAIEFIFKAKSGPFYEHSNQLWNISGVDDWGRINRGLMTKYTDEILHKFPVVQHVWFGKHVLAWND